MGRERQSEEVKRAVVETARGIFLHKGYAQTTIRQISAAAGVSSGSIYHFFLNKEGVFRDVALQSFEKMGQIADNATPANADPYLRLAIRWGLLVRLISSDQRTAELFSMAYSSWDIGQELLEIGTQLHAQLFKPLLPEWTQDQFFIATLLLGGALSSLADERVHLNRLTEAQRAKGILRIILPAFGADAKKIEQTTASLLTLLPELSIGAFQAAVPTPAASRSARHRHKR